MSKVKLGEVDKGTDRGPGSNYTDRMARVCRVRKGRYELYIRSEYGYNGGRGARQPTETKERMYRASSIDNLMRIGIAEVRGDDDLEDDGRLVAAIREACIAAEDAEADETPSSSAAEAASS